MTRKTVSMLNHGALERIHQESLRILENIGVQCDDPVSIEVLRKAGAKVTGQTGVVRVPAPMVEEAMAQISRRFELVHPSGERFWAPPPRPMVGTRVKMPKILDYGASEARRPTRQDVINLCRLTQSLKGCSFSVAIPYASSDVPSEIDFVDSLALEFAVTGRHVLCSAPKLEDALLAIDVSIEATGSSDLGRNPALWFALSTTSPLRLAAEEAIILRHIAERRLPFSIGPMAIAGGTTPFTLAGTLLVENAETLFTCVLANAIWPGAKILHGPNGNNMNMKSASISLGSAESRLLSSGEVALGQYYGMPTYRMGGCYSESYYPDVQAGIEKATAELILAQSNADFILNGGPLNSASHLSYESLIIDHEIWEYCERIATEIAVNDDTLAYDVIERIGPGGSYLSDEHTMKWLRSGEHYYGGSFNHTGRSGEPSTMLARVHQRVEALLSAPFRWGAPPESVSRLKLFVRDHARRQNVRPPEWTE